MKGMSLSLWSPLQVMVSRRVCFSCHSELE
uniref:Uncharacterized protein n=1 Tax=Anguilla anguilla TaxID=7936 RepID=A0A0E9PW37_ANGAN